MKILLVAKHSKYEWERKKFNLTHEELVKKYNKEHANLDAIMLAYEHQVKVRDQFKAVFKSAKFLMMHEAEKPLSSDIDLVIVLGGDNSFTNISHYVGSVPILGVNSDPRHSTGYLLNWSTGTPEDVNKLAEKLYCHQFIIEDWTRLQAKVDGKVITPATSEYFFGETQRNHMSRHVLEWRGKSYEQKCSGVIVATGAGSTGWFRSTQHGGAHVWEPRDKHCALVVTEMYSSAPMFSGMTFFDPNDKIVLHSLNDDGGIVSVDSWDEFPFHRGTTVELEVGEPLKVLVPDEK